MSPARSVALSVRPLLRVLRSVCGCLNQRTYWNGLRTLSTGTMADDEPVDPLTQIRESCGETKSCMGAMSEYKACIDRVANKGFGTCEPWFFDYISCVDKCAAPKIMKATK